MWKSYAGWAQPNGQGVATVNPIFTWVRLAQRIPVRIAIDHVPPAVVLSAGMTATVQIDAARSAGRDAGKCKERDLRRTRGRSATCAVQDFPHIFTGDQFPMQRQVRWVAFFRSIYSRTKDFQDAAA